MKIITLAMPSIVGGVVRNPIEGPLTIGADEAERLKESGLLACDPEDLPTEGDDEAEADDDLEALTLPDLGILVTKEGVPLNGATKKADIITAIRAHRDGTAA